jgi:hypothetical protein
MTEIHNRGAAEYEKAQDSERIPGTKKQGGF